MRCSTSSRPQRHRANGLPNGAARFNGTTQFLVAPAGDLFVITTGTSATILFWLNITALPHANNAIAGKDDDETGIGSDFFIYVDSSGNFSWQLQHAGGGNTVDSVTWGTPLATGIWYFCVCRYDAPNNQLSINVNNGTPVAAAVTATINQSNTPFAVGVVGAAIGTLQNGPTWSADVPTAISANVNSLSFVAASNQYVSQQCQHWSTNNLTLGAWIKVNSLPSDGDFMGVICPDGGTAYLIVRNTGGVLYATGNVLDSIVAVGTSITSNITLNVWHHIVFTFTASGSMLIYVDGAQVATAVAPASANVISSTSAVGAYAPGSLLKSFDGRIAETHIYLRTLSAGEIATWATGTEPSTANLVSRMRLNDGAGGFAVDIAPVPSAAGGFFSGKIGPLAVLNRLLTSTEETILYNRGSGRYYSQLPSTLRSESTSAFVSWWDMMESTGATRADSRNSSNNLADRNNASLASGIPGF